MNYEIAIPSYRRSQLLKEKTLKLLSDTNIKNIRIFVRDQEELSQYIRDCGNGYEYIITHAKGIKNTRNFLRNYYYTTNKHLDFVLFVDDDIDSLEKLKCSNEKIKITPEKLEQEILNMYNETKKRNLKFWGICGFNNAFFMKDTISTNLKYIIGAFCGLVKPSEGELIETVIEHGEDYEFTIKHFLTDGGVVRFNNYCINTKYYREEGGICQDLGGIEKRNENAKESLTYLENEYPEMGKMIQKKNGMYDFRFNSRFKNKKNN